MVSPDYSSLLVKEECSLEAINALREDYPYAASLLIYTVLERCLKIYLMGNRNDKKVRSEFNLNTRIKNRKSNNLRDLINDNVNDEGFIKEVLMHCPLGTLEDIYNIHTHPFSKNRNDIVHSNLYLHDQRSDSCAERMKKNKQYLGKAIKDLIKASRYFKKGIIDENRVLKFK